MGHDPLEAGGCESAQRGPVDGAAEELTGEEEPVIHLRRAPVPAAPGRQLPPIDFIPRLYTQEVEVVCPYQPRMVRCIKSLRRPLPPTGSTQNAHQSDSRPPQAGALRKNRSPPGASPAYKAPQKSQQVNFVPSSHIAFHHKLPNEIVVAYSRTICNNGCV